MDSYPAPNPAPDTTGLLAFRRYTAWSLAGGVAIVLAVPFIRSLVVATDAPLLLIPWWLGLAAVAVSAAVMIVRLVPTGSAFLDRWLRGETDPGGGSAGVVPPPPATVVTGALGATVVAGLMLADGDVQFWGTAPAVVLSLRVAFLPDERRRPPVAIAMLLGAAVSVVVAWPDTAMVIIGAMWTAGVIGFVSFMNLAQLWTWEVASRLDDARTVAARLAVADERLRFAADLHDIQGHHLQVIALKSELAARLVDQDPAAASAQMRETQQLAATALRDTRAVVQGYRRTSLDEEIANATGVLAAADIDGRMQVEGEVGSLSKGCRHLLGLVVREATTNVLRHSQARRADVRLQVETDGAVLTVVNDGVEASPPGARSGAAGSGLTGLAARLAEVGGRLTWERVDDRFHVTARLPADVPAPAVGAGVTGGADGRGAADGAS